MEFNICVKNHNDLLIADASLSLGWFKIIQKELCFEFFSQGLCMVFITLTDLLDYIKNKELHNGQIFNWNGVDNGASFFLKTKKNLLEIERDGTKICLDFDKFKTAVFSSVTEFMNNCLLNNDQIEHEGAFSDLLQAFKG